MNLITIILYAAVRRTSMHLYLSCISSAAALCVAIFLLLQLKCCCKLAAAVCHRVPDDTICCCGLLHLLPAFSFSSFKHDLFLMYHLAVLSHLRPRSSYIFGNYGHARSQGGRQVNKAKPPCIRYEVYTLGGPAYVPEHI